MVELSTVNQILDILVKIVFLVIFVFAILLMRKLEDVLESAERSAQSFEHTAETVERLIDLGNFLPFVGKKRKRVKADEVVEDE